MSEGKLKVGDKVEVVRQIGKNGIPKEVTGIVRSLSSTITINGEKTAHIKYDDGVEDYWHPISQIKILTP